MDPSFKIKEIRTWKTWLRRAVAWKTARYTKGDIEAAVIQITDENGLSGYGYVPAMLLEGESGPSAQILLNTVLKPIILRPEIAGVQPLIKELDMQLPLNFQLKFAVEEALLDLQGKQKGVPVYDLIGGLSRRDVPVMRILGLKSAKETAEEACSYIAKGYTHLKMKVGADETRDVECMQAVREAVGKDIIIAADANRSYAGEVRKAIRIINKLEKFGLDGMEQPVGRDDYKGMAFVRQRVSCPIFADEGVLTVADAVRYIDAEAMDVVSLKLWKVGGFTKAREIAALCRAHHIPCHIGSTPGSQLLEAGQLQFAASVPDLCMGAEIDMFTSFTEDPASGLEVKNGVLTVTDAPGLGINIDLSKATEVC